MKTSSTKPTMHTMPAGEFKAKCLKLMDEVMAGKLTIVVTKRGKPVMQAIAPELPKKKPFRPVWGRTPNVKILGDITEPLDWPDPSIKWDRVNKQKKVK